MTAGSNPVIQPTINRIFSEIPSINVDLARKGSAKTADMLPNNDKMYRYIRLMY